MPWIWDPAKNRANKLKHRLSFETAQLVFDDPLAASRIDAGHCEEERWQTVGAIGDVVVHVVHTAPDDLENSAEQAGRIISARKATPRERKAYEKGQF